MRTHGWRQIRTSFCVRRTELCSTYNCIVHQPILAFRQLPTTASVGVVWGFFPASCQVPININLSEFIFIDRLNSRMSNKFFNTLLAAGCWRNAKKMLSTVVRPCAVGWGSWAAAASSEGGGGVKNATSTKGISPTRAREPVMANFIAYLNRAPTWVSGMDFCPFFLWVIRHWWTMRWNQLI